MVTSLCKLWIIYRYISNDDNALRDYSNIDMLICYQAGWLNCEAKWNEYLIWSNTKRSCPFDYHVILSDVKWIGFVWQESHIDKIAFDTCLVTKTMCYNITWYCTQHNILKCKTVVRPRTHQDTWCLSWVFWENDSDREIPETHRNILYVLSILLKKCCLRVISNDESISHEPKYSEGIGSTLKLSIPWFFTTVHPQPCFGCDKKCFYQHAASQNSQMINNGNTLFDILKHFLCKERIYATYTYSTILANMYDPRIANALTNAHWLFKLFSGWSCLQLWQNEVGIGSVRHQLLCYIFPNKPRDGSRDIVYHAVCISYTSICYKITFVRLFVFWKVKNEIALFW